MAERENNFDAYQANGEPVEPCAYSMLGRTLERQGRPDEAGPWLRAAEAFSAS